MPDFITSTHANMHHGRCVALASIRDADVHAVGARMACCGPVMNACFMKEPSTSLWDMGKTSCQKSTLTEKLRAESTLYTVLSSP